MKIIQQSAELMTLFPENEILEKLELYGRTCYQSEHRIGKNTASKFVKSIMKNNHLSVLEHISLTFRFITDRGVTHELVRHRLASYCLAGDTIIKGYATNPKHQGKSWTIEQLYNWQRDKKRKGRLSLINLRSVDDRGIIVPNKIKQVIKSGVKDVYLVKTVSGRSIKSTMEHRYFTPNGYKHLSELSIGDRVYANGIDALDNKEYIEKRYLEDNLTRKDLAKEIGCCEALLYRAFKKFNIFKPWSNRPNRKAGRGIKGMHSEEEKLRISARMSGENNHRWKGNNITESAGRLRANKKYTPDICWGCGCTDNLERHHVDKNPKNNAEDNIKFLCSKCHKGFHFTNVATVFSDEISSIEYFGSVMTYDLEMVDEPHNFVANGLVVHNSQESTRYVKYTDLEVIEPVGMSEPERDVWQYYMSYAEGNYRAMINYGLKPEQARTVLPHSAKTEIVMTANLREWLHIIKLRTSKAAHPQIRDLIGKAQEILSYNYPTIFGSNDDR